MEQKIAVALGRWAVAVAGLGLAGCGAPQAKPVAVETAVEAKPEVPCAEAPAPSSPGGSAAPSAPPPAEEPAKNSAAEEPPPPEPPPSAANIGGDEGDEEAARSGESGSSPQSVPMFGR